MLICSCQKDRELKLIIARPVVEFGWIVENWIKSLIGNQLGQQPVKPTPKMPPDKSTQKEISIMTVPNTMTNMVGNTVRMITTMKESTGKENGKGDLFLGIYLILGIEGQGLDE